MFVSWWKVLELTLPLVKCGFNKNTNIWSLLGKIDSVFKPCFARSYKKLHLL